MSAVFINLLGLAVSLSPPPPSAPAGSPVVAADESPRMWVVIVIGLAGDEEHGPLFDQTLAAWKSFFRERLAVPAERVVVCRGQADAERPAGELPATRAALDDLFNGWGDTLRREDTLWVVTLGHGHSDGRRAWLHVPGPDPESRDFVRWLNGIPAERQLIWLTQAASGAWVKPLARSGRTVIAATAPEQEENETEFPHAWAAVAQNATEKLDRNADRQISLAELFRAIVDEVNARFERNALLATEHAQLDDNGDGRGTEVDQLHDGLDATAPEVSAPDSAPDSPATPAPQKPPAPQNAPGSKDPAALAEMRDGRVAARWILWTLPPAAQP